ncbi:MAG: 1-acyl-sn-glycerol-3-phosphate acyltransferase [Treponemataceae bacterium]
MKGISIKEKYGYLFQDLKNLGHSAKIIDSENVYQEANMSTRPILEKICDDFVMDSSRFEGKEHIEEFFDQIKSGKRGLIMMEHYSNMDLPVLVYLLERKCGSKGKQLADELVAIAGMKLNEESSVVRAWAEAFTRIVVYPSRSIAAISDPEQRIKEEAKSRSINMAAMRAMDRVKKDGRPILVFPAGTRYRPGVPETKKGVREIDSYLRLFDIMILISENGNVLRINPEKSKDMLEDQFFEDTIILSASPIIECKKFRNDILDELEDYEGDKKIIVVNRIMEELQKLHDKYAGDYQSLYRQTFNEDSCVQQ